MCGCSRRSRAEGSERPVTVSERQPFSERLRSGKSGATCSISPRSLLSRDQLLLRGLQEFLRQSFIIPQCWVGAADCCGALGAACAVIWIAWTIEFTADSRGSCTDWF